MNRHPGRDTSPANDITVAVVSHKPYPAPNKSPYLPLHLGAALHPDILEDWAQDNTGTNISEKNGEYSELTGLYWLWKNCNSQYQGLVHYRRYLGSKSLAGRMPTNHWQSRVVQEDELRELFQSVDIILPRKRNYFIETIYSHYVHTFPAIQLDETREIIDSTWHGYLPAFDHVMGSTTAHMFNIFIMEKKKLDDYCSWLFPILAELENHIDDTGYDAFNLRYLGRISEMLLDVWLYTNGYGFTELPIINSEPVNWVKKGSSFLRAKFTGKKYASSF